MTKINFTKKTIETLPLPDKGKRVTYHDTKIPGLTIRLSSTGVKSFSVRRKLNGRAERVTLGKYPDMTIEQARKQAANTNASIINGISVNKKKKSLRNETTLGELFGIFMERHAKPHKKSWKNDEGQFNLHLLHWSNRKISELTAQDIQKLHTGIGKNSGKYAANRVLALLHTLFSHAINWGWEEKNPVAGVKKFNEQARERFLTADELPRFFTALDKEENQMMKDFFMLSILTGARKANLLAMRWDEISLGDKLWVIPYTKAKTKENYHIPLVPEALEILTRRPSNSCSEWVFPSSGQTGHLVEPKKAWHKLLERAELSGLRIHDIRRSLGSWQASTGANLSVIGKTLGHKNTSTTAIYARLDLNSVRHSMEVATNAMLNAKKNKT